MNMSSPDSYDDQKIISELANHYILRRERSRATNFAIYDTFDWRLFEKSLGLYNSANELILHRLSEHEIVQRTRVASQPVFLSDFPDGGLKESLASIIEMRALLKLADVHSQSITYCILNQEEKTVVRFSYEEIRAGDQIEGPMLSVHLRLEPIRGYPRYYRTLVKRLEEMGFVKINPAAVYFKALEVARKTPGDYSSKLNLQLVPDMRADEATKTILRSLLEIIRINENYVKADLDTEFLHDFRVAIRRTRATLSQIKGVFPSDITKRFRRDFSFLGKLSNQLRDLDVYLLKETTYKAMLPESLRDDINPLFDFLKEKRLDALEEVRNGLDSQKYSEIIRGWEVFLNQLPEDTPTLHSAGIHIFDLAQRRIYKTYRKTLKTAARIFEAADDELLHTLRIECKKLRYLMEFFSSLFPSNKISILIRELRKLQDNLGDFNDLCIQKEYLQTITEELPITGQQSRRTILAIGSLIGTLEEESQAAKDSFSKIFSKFTSLSSRELYRELFAAKKGKVSS